MNVEEIQKVDLLAKTLQSQGIATSPSDAADKANEIINVTEDKNVEEDVRIHLLERKYKNLLNENNNQFFSEINDIKTALSSLNNELSSVKNQLRENKEKINEQLVKSEPETKEVQVKIEDSKEIKKEPHPRQGNYNPDDVSIEKFFYCGVK